MGKKFLKFLICLSLLTGFVMAMSAFAASAGAKIGVKNGDTVIFAGKNSPVRWRVIDADKSNTGNKNGILLLSNDNLINVESPTKKADWTQDACKTFYSDNFDSADKGAVMTVSKTDEAFPYESFSLNGSLPTGTTVFALSAQEFNSLNSELKKFNGSENCYLRSVAVLTYTTIMYSYADSSGKIDIKSSGLGGNANFKIRPAVNLDKTKLASIDGKLLLLPAGESQGAENKFAEVGTANEWKLSAKSNVEVESAVTENNTENSLTLNIDLNSVRYGYISAIIVKADGTVSHYARYRINGLSLKQNIELPSDINLDTDSMYVFFEDYQKTLPGSVSEPKKVCLKHAYGEYTSVDGSSHEHTCLACGYKETDSHSFGAYTCNDDNHERSCTVCGYKETGSHSFGAYTYNDDNHERSCTVCDFKETGKHTLNYASTDALTHMAYCFCGYSRNEAHSYKVLDENESEINCSLCEKANFSAFKGSLDADRLRNEYVDSSEEIYKNKDNQNATALIPGDQNKANLSFKTKSPIIAKGFQIKQKAQEVNCLPESITLYGKNTGDSGYTKIETVAYKSVFGTETADGTYTFLFSAKSDFTAYDDYKAEFSFGTDYNPEKQF